MTYKSTEEIYFFNEVFGNTCGPILLEIFVFSNEEKNFRSIERRENVR